MKSHQHKKSLSLNNLRRQQPFLVMQIPEPKRTLKPCKVKRNENRLRVSAGFVLNMAESLNDILIENGEEPVEVTVTNSGPYTKEWYDEVTRIEKESVSRASAVTGNAVPSSAADMIAESLKESYADMERINRIAAMGYITDVESPAVAEVEEMLRENPMFVLFAILFLQN